MHYFPTLATSTVTANTTSSGPAPRYNTPSPSPPDSSSLPVFGPPRRPLPDLPYAGSPIQDDASISSCSCSSSDDEEDKDDDPASERELNDEDEETKGMAEKPAPVIKIKELGPEKEKKRVTFVAEYEEINLEKGGHRPRTHESELRRCWWGGRRKVRVAERGDEEEDEDREKERDRMPPWLSILCLFLAVMMVLVVLPGIAFAIAVSINWAAGGS